MVDSYGKPPTDLPAAPVNDTTKLLHEIMGGQQDVNTTSVLAATDSTALASQIKNMQSMLASSSLLSSRNLLANGEHHLSMIEIEQQEAFLQKERERIKQE